MFSRGCALALLASVVALAPQGAQAKPAPSKEAAASCAVPRALFKSDETHAAWKRLICSPEGQKAWGQFNEVIARFEQDYHRKIDGPEMLKMTTAQYFLGSVGCERPIQGVGVKPDIPLVPTAEEKKSTARCKERLAHSLKTAKVTNGACKYHYAVSAEHKAAAYRMLEVMGLTPVTPPAKPQKRQLSEKIPHQTWCGFCFADMHHLRAEGAHLQNLLSMGVGAAMVRTSSTLRMTGMRTVSTG